jgi:hypothetical protein
MSHLRGAREGGRAKKTANLGDVKTDKSFAGDGVTIIELDHVYIDFGSADGRR